MSKQAEQVEKKSEAVSNEVPEGFLKEPVTSNAENEGEKAPAPVAMNEKDGEHTGVKPASDLEAVNHFIAPSPEIAQGQVPDEDTGDNYGFDEDGNFQTGDGRSINPAHVTWVEASPVRRGAPTIVVFHIVGGDTVGVRTTDAQAFKDAYDHKKKLKAKSKK